MNDEMNQIFIDGISAINFVNGMVRLTVGTMIPADEDTENAQPIFKNEYRIIMPLNSFLAGFTSQKQLIEKLENNNIITKQEDPQNTNVNVCQSPDVIPFNK